MRRLKTRIRKLITRIKLETEIRKLETKIRKLETQIRKLETRTRKLKNRIKKLEPRIRKLDTRTRKLKTRIRKLKTRIRDIRIRKVKTCSPERAILADYPMLTRMECDETVWFRTNPAFFCKTGGFNFSDRTRSIINDLSVVVLGSCRFGTDKIFIDKSSQLRVLYKICRSFSALVSNISISVFKNCQEYSDLIHKMIL